MAARKKTTRKKTAIALDDTPIPFRDVVKLATKMLKGNVSEKGKIERIAPKRFGQPHLGRVMARTLKWVEQQATAGKAVSSQALADVLRLNVGESMTKYGEPT